jgi:hypothetical protein
MNAPELKKMATLSGERPSSKLHFNNNIHEHTFNNDLLANDSDRIAAGELYPTLVGVLCHRALIDYFKRYDERANTAKRTSRQWGKWAIVLASLAVALAALELFLEAKGSDLSLIIAGVAATCGLASVIIGAIGILYGARKKEWLHNRFMGERIRQFHFQSLIALFPEITACLLNNDDKAEQTKRQFESKRDSLFIQFQSEFEGAVDSKYTSATGPFGEADCWLVDLTRASSSESGHVLEPFFSAYRQLRIKHQLSYANYKLQGDRKLFSAMPIRQSEVLESVSMLGIALLFLSHLAVIAIVVITLGSIILGSPINDPLSVGSKIISIVFSFAIVMVAVIALAARAFQQGLQPEREIERYQQYRSALQLILERYDAANTPQQKVKIMEQMERLVFDEMRNFLSTHSRSSFAM